MDDDRYDVLSVVASFFVSGLAFFKSIRLVKAPKTQPGNMAETRFGRTKIHDQSDATKLTQHLPPTTINYEDDLKTERQIELSGGVLSVVGDRIEFYREYDKQWFTLKAQHLREITFLTPLSEGRRIKFAIYSEAETGWRTDVLSVASLNGCEALISAVRKISGLTPSIIPGIGPLKALSYCQDMLGHWERGDMTKLYLITRYLIFNWQTSIQLEDVHELTVHPSPGSDTLNATALLVIKHRITDGRLQTDGFDMEAKDAYIWARELHLRSGAPLHVFEERKKKA